MKKPWENHPQIYHRPTTICYSAGRMEQWKNKGQISFQEIPWVFFVELPLTHFVCFKSSLIPWYHPIPSKTIESSMGSAENWYPRARYNGLFLFSNCLMATPDGLLVHGYLFSLTQISCHCFSPTVWPLHPSVSPYNIFCWPLTILMRPSRQLPWQWAAQEVVTKSSWRLGTWMCIPSGCAPHTHIYLFKYCIYSYNWWYSISNWGVWFFTNS